MLDHPNKNGHSNGYGNGGLVVEDTKNLTFSVHRKVFVSPEILEDENRAIFDKCWVYVGHAAEIPEAGDYKTTFIGRNPVIVSRLADGDITLLINRCRHRGPIVCQHELGNSQHFRCP